MRSRAPLLSAILMLLLAAMLGAQASLSDLIARADVNDSGTVDRADLAIVQAALGRRCSQPATWNPRLDMNGDCVIDTRDLAFVSQFIGNRVPPDPTITATVSPVANAAGWNNTNVTVTFICVNAVSCTSPVTVSTDGANQQITGTAVGQVTGHNATKTVAINLDKTAPAVTIASPTDGSTVLTPSVSLHVTYPASASPIKSATCNGVPAASFFDVFFDCDVPLGLGPNTITAVVTDTAGNTGQASITVTRQGPPPPPEPTISGVITPAPNLAGWNNTDVTISFTCTNAATCPADIPVTTEGANQQFTRTATGPGGSTDATVTVNLDKTAPVVTFTLPANNSTSTTQPVTVAGTVTNIAPIASAASGSGVPIEIVALSLTSVEPLTLSGDNAIQWTVTDVAGNTGSATLHVVYQPPAPTIVASADRAPNGAGWYNADVTVSFVCQNNTSPCPASQVVSAEGVQTVTGQVSGAGGTTANASVTLNIDKTAPAVAFSSPGDNSTSTASPITVQGSVSDGGGSPIVASSLTCNGAAAALNGQAFSCSVPLQDGANSIPASVTDAAGNTGTATLHVTYQSISGAAPIVLFTSPSSLSVFNAQQVPITVTGTVDLPNATVVVTSPNSPLGVQAGVTGNTWTASDVSLKEGNNLLTATASAPGRGTSSATLTVNLDTTPPILLIDSPPANAVLTNGQISVSGVVNDIVAGTVNSEQVTVQVNGLDAQVANRSFVVPELLLARGLNTLTAVAIDRAGNRAQAQIQVTLQDSLQQQRIEVVSGDHQTGPISTELPEPLVVRLLDASGAPVANRAVSFRVVKSEGTMKNGDELVQDLSVQTDDQGRASTAFTLGSRSGVGNNQVSATATGFAGTVIFSESATVGAAAQINVVSGSNQRGAIGQPLPLPFIVIVYDAGGNPVAGEPVTFKIPMDGGGGMLGDVSELIINTNSDGKATALLTLGPTEGVNNNQVLVSYGTGDPETLGGNQRVTFTATGLVPGTLSETRVSGVVLDNTEGPIPDATAIIVGTNLTARTDASGRFSIAGAPVGTVTLIVDGSTSSRPETFPFLAFVLNTVAGLDNTVGMPIYIPPIDLSSAQLAGADEDVVLTMDGVPGVAFTVKAHSTTTPDGMHQPVRMMLSQVHADKVPMPPPNGSAPRLVWTLQPAGVHFDPPIQVQLPNTDGLAPGTVLEIYQFDHDLEQFVSTGPGRISPDGSVLVSDPGFGITKSGWGVPQPPPPPKNCTLYCNDQNVCTTDSKVDPPCVCANTPGNNGAACGGPNDGANSCRQPGTCQGGACSGQPKPAGSSCDDKIFCTDPDTCQAGGGCSGTPIAEKQGPNVTVEIKLDFIKDAVENYISKFLPIKETSITFSSEGNEKDICCEVKQQKDVAVKTVKWSGNIKVETDKLFIPALSFNIKVVKIGVFAKFGVGLQAFLQGENDFCQGNGVCWGGGFQLAGNVEFGIAAQDDAKVVSISASCQSGLELDANVSCKEYQIGLSTQPVKCKINVELFDGFVAFGLEKELLPSVPLIGGQKNPLPSF